VPPSDVAGAAVGADLVDDRENDVFGGDAEGKRALDVDEQIFRFFLRQALRREDVFDLGGADPESQRAESAVRRGVRIAADDRHPGLREALFGAENVNDALFDPVEIVKPDAELAGVFSQRLDLLGGDPVVEGQMTVDRRDRVVERREGQLGPAHAAAGEPQAFEGLRARHFVHEVQIDVKQGGLARFFGDDVRVPDFIVKRFHLLTEQFLLSRRGHGVFRGSEAGPQKYPSPSRAKNH
jgi:hypothetical protein